jgi:hypothetical protein
MLEEIGFADIVIGPPVDTFGGARGEANARTFEGVRLCLPRPQARPLSAAAPAAELTGTAR